MSQSATLIIERKIDLSPLASIEGLTVIMSPDGKTPVEISKSSDCSSYIYFDGWRQGDDYAEDYLEDHQVVKVVGEFDLNAAAYLTIRFGDFNLMKRMASCILSYHPKSFFDGDYGVFMPSAKFVAKVESDPRWDWRKRPKKYC